MLKIQQLYNDFRVDHITENDKNKHARRDWVQVHCPFCRGSQNYHLGYNTAQGFFCCWRCKFHGEVKVLQKILSVTVQEAKEIAKRYRTKGFGGKRFSVAEKADVGGVCRLPKWCGLTEHHTKYLESRGYDINMLTELWGVTGTLHSPRVCNVNFSYRVIAPIYYGLEMVSFQGRDFTGKSHLKYITSPKQNEVIHHKDIVYGYDMVPGDSVVITEGVFDVWKLGPGAVCTFGIGFSKAQQALLSEFSNRFILYDTEDGEAREKAKELAYQLACYGGRTEIITLPWKGKDPGDLTPKQGAEVMRELLI